jgi:hypothetical protein
MKMGSASFGNGLRMQAVPAGAGNDAQLKADIGNGFGKKVTADQESRGGFSGGFNATLRPALQLSCATCAP